MEVGHQHVHGNGTHTPGRRNSAVSPRSRAGAPRRPRRARQRPQGRGADGHHPARRASAPGTPPRTPPPEPPATRDAGHAIRPPRPGSERTSPRRRAGVTCAISTPRSSIAAISSPSKCRPAGGAATPPPAGARTPSGSARRPRRPPRGGYREARARRRLALDEPCGVVRTGEFQLEQIVAPGAHHEAAAPVHRQESAVLRLLAEPQPGEHPVRGENALDQDLDTPPRRLGREEPARTTRVVVDHDDVGGVQIFGEVGKRPVGNRRRGCIEDQQALSRAPGSRTLGDQLRRQLVIEVGHAHGAQW